jgi:penicillin-binding protein 2
MAVVDLDDHVHELRVFRGRVVTAVGFVALLAVMLAARLIVLQVVQYEHFATRSDENRLKIIPVPPTRGLIYDRSGQLLAQNRPSYRLEITPEEVDDMDATLARLAQLIDLRPLDIERFDRLRQRKPAFEAVPLRFNLNEDEVASFAVNRHHFPGVEIAARLSRHYPIGEEIVHAIGYVGRIDERELKQVDTAEYAGSSHIGKVGVEGAYEDTLHGQVGHQRVEINAAGRVVGILEETLPRPGKNLYLTIDVGLQRAALDALGEFTGAVVAIDPRNGDVLALVSKPGYDPNLFVNGIEPEQYRALSTNPDRPLFNRALRGQYPPGSTIKPFYGLAALELGVQRADHGTYCPGYFRLPGQTHRFRCWKKGGHGYMNLDRAIVQSCDTYFYDLAVKLGINRMHDFMTHFGFGVKSKIDIGGEVSGVMPSPEWKRATKGTPWYQGETVIAGIGQGYMLTTPAQLANAAAIMANRGHGFHPRLVYALGDPLTGAMEMLPPRPMEPMAVQAESHWDYVFDSMEQVVHSPRGTARRIGQGIDYRVAGKTGTAQVFSIKQNEEYDERKIDKRLRDHALFIAFAPVEAPRIALGIIVENGGHGGSAAAPVARRVFDHFFGAATTTAASEGDS